MCMLPAATVTSRATNRHCIKAAPVHKGAMSVDWQNSKAQKLLESEMRNRSIPFENKKMGSKAVFEKHKACAELQAMTYDKTFQRRLASLRKIVKETEEDEGVEWDTSEVKAFLKHCFEDGVTPLSYRGTLTPREAAKKIGMSTVQANLLLRGWSSIRFLNRDLNQLHRIMIPKNSRRLTMRKPSNSTEQNILSDLTMILECLVGKGPKQKD